MKFPKTLLAVIGCAALAACSGGSTEEDNVAEMDANMMVADNLDTSMDANMMSEMNATDANAGMSSDANMGATNTTGDPSVNITNGTDNAAGNTAGTTTDGGPPPTL